MVEEQHCLKSLKCKNGVFVRCQNMKLEFDKLTYRQCMTYQHSVCQLFEYLLLDFFFIHSGMFATASCFLS